MRDHDVALVADPGRLDVLVGARVLFDGGDVQPALVGERAVAHVGRVGQRRPVQPLVEQPRDVGEPRQLVLADADLEVGLEHEGGDQRDQVGVAAALAQAVEGALNLARPGVDGGQ